MSQKTPVHTHTGSCGPHRPLPLPTSPPLPFQVMLLKNFDQANKLVNGSRGVVVGFEPPPSHERMRRVAMHPPAASPLIPRVSSR